ncbi:MAG TPA: hypothetical protein VJ652_12195, partial [Noviherbaspirillum sp.]|nr:hypothetical protein [Noviherbaspirillum sp.]
GRSLFCFAKKVSKKGDPTADARCAGSQKCACQNGKRNKLAFGSDRFRFLIRFDRRTFGVVRKGGV